MSKSSNLIWIDLEMTGLDPNKERIVEIATVVTDKDLRILAEGPVIAVNQPLSILDAMDEWCTDHHGSSGLTQRVIDSKISNVMAEKATVEFLKQWVEPGKSPMCGNSIGQDRRFLIREMPKLAQFFHYRSIDVSTLKELAARWKPEIMNGFIKKCTHLALEDVHESINELVYYRKHFINL